MNMSTSNIIIGQKVNDKAILALSSTIHALYELECYAIGRLVVKDGKPPLVVLLAPLIEPDFECLVEVQLPFAEDMRSYRFPPLDKIVTVSGKVVKEHRNLPSDDLLDAMEKYVDDMDLSEFDKNGYHSSRFSSKVSVLIQPTDILQSQWHWSTAFQHFSIE